MEGLLTLVGLVVVAGAAIAILWSIGRGLILLRKTYTDNEPNKSGRRLVAWNLIEPGITVPNILILLALESEYAAYAMWPFRDLGFIGQPGILRYLVSVSICFWPMIVLFMIIPLMARMSSDPQVRWAAGKTAKLGIIRMIITIITYATVGVGMLVGVPYLLWSLKKIRLWNDEMLGKSQSKPMAAIVGGKEGMLVLPTNQQTPSNGFKVLLSKE